MRILVPVGGGAALTAGAVIAPATSASAAEPITRLAAVAACLALAAYTVLINRRHRGRSAQ
ncbi:hypothetical protein ACFYZJ_26930 [Streptomyces sp. NPDC001848]|uniref:hypothetical protein n=1 Tax=Streptomyces sp. NPDC001848 TaxID=3364618 RepID=UPI0036CCBEF4